MEYDTADLQFDDNRLSHAHVILVKIIYTGSPSDASADESSTQLGWMVYLKLAMTDAEPAYVKIYQRTQPAFPLQFFDEAQFEAYRMLGECAAKSLFRREIVGDSLPDNLEDWFQALANNLLPDNDAVFSKK